MSNRVVDILSDLRTEAATLRKNEGAGSHMAALLAAAGDEITRLRGLESAITPEFVGDVKRWRDMSERNRGDYWQAYLRRRDELMCEDEAEDYREEAAKLATRVATIDAFLAVTPTEADPDAAT